jgi:hypothetical protein
MNYNEWLDDIFIEHHNCMGSNMSEIIELMEYSTIDQRKRWLNKNGYNVSIEEYELQCG